MIEFKASIVIPVFNNINFTKSCIGDLSKLPSDHEIIIVDNGSTDETRSICLALQEQFINANGNLPSLKYFQQAENLGFAKACNIGYRHSVGEVVVFLNNDIRVQSDFATWTSNLIKEAEAGYLVGPTGGLITKSCDFIKETNKLESGIYYMSGWCLAASRKVFDSLILPGETGPFSSEFGIAYFEDTDLSLRAKGLGIPFKIQEVPVHHFGKMTSKKVGISKLYPVAKEIFKRKWTTKLNG